MKTTITLTIQIDKDSFDEAKKKNGGSLSEPIEEALSEVFASAVDVKKWSAKHEEESHELPID